MIAELLAAATISGALPPALGPPSRVLWIEIGGGTRVECAVVPPDRWECAGVPETLPGIVIFVGTGAVAHQCIAACGGDSGITTHRWGGLVVLDSGGAPPDDLRQVRLTAWKPERSAVRTAVRRFRAIDDGDVEIVRLSDLMFWVAGDLQDPASFLSVDGPAIGSTGIPASTLAEGSPETPFFVFMTPRSVLTGRVQDSAGQDVNQIEIELFEPMRSGNVSANTPLESQPLILRATTFSDISGGFTFDHMAPGRYFISVVDDVAGRGSQWIETLAEPVVIRLVAPTRATGRVLKRQEPEPSARVRFVPNVETFMAGVDARVAIGQETTTDLDGSFSLALPPESAGAIQIIASDGATARVPIFGAGKTKEIALGDILLPDHRVLAVRLLDTASCTLSATGPLQYLGLTIVQAIERGGLHWFDIPESGEWAIAADCSGVNHPVVPTVVSVPATGLDTFLDVRIAR